MFQGIQNRIEVMEGVLAGMIFQVVVRALTNRTVAIVRASNEALFGIVPNVASENRVPTTMYSVPTRNIETVDTGLEQWCDDVAETRMEYIS